MVNILGTEEKMLRGVKGRSPLLDLDFFDPVTMTPVEVMHTFDLGVIKLFLKLWTSTTPTITQWQLTEEQKLLLQARLDSIQVPHLITRKPRLQNKDDWKAAGKSQNKF